MAIATSNVRFWHDLKEGVGTTVFGQTGGGNGTLQSSPTWTTGGPTGISPNGVNFASAIDQKRITTVGTTVAQVAFAASAWFSKAAASSQGGLFASSSVTSGQHVFEIRIDSSGNIAARVVNPGVGDDFLITSSGTDYRDGAVHHVLFQRDASGNAELFVDNVSKGTASNTTALTGGKTCIIGNQFAADSSTEFNLAGKAFQCILFDAVLNSTERAALYNSGAGVRYGDFFSVLNFSPLPAAATNTVSALSSYPTGSWTPPTTGLLILEIHSDTSTTATVNTPTVSGNGVTWTVVAALAGASTSQGQFIAFANAAGATVGATTVDFGGQTQAACVIQATLADYSDVANGVAQCAVQTVTASPTSANPGTATLAAASNAANRPLAMLYNNGGDTVTPNTNWTELSDTGGTSRAQEVQVRLDAFDTSVSATASTTRNWFIIALEVKAKVVAAAVNSGFLRFM